MDVNEEIGSEIVNLKMIQASCFDPKRSPSEMLILYIYLGIYLIGKFISQPEADLIKKRDLIRS